MGLIKGMAEYEEARRLWCEDQLTSAELAARYGLNKNQLLGMIHRNKADFPPKANPIKRTRADGSPSRRPKKSVFPKPPTRAEIRASGYTALGTSGHKCQWPIGNPSEEDFHFCEKPAVNGRPYCPSHCGIAFIKIKPDAA